MGDWHPRQGGGGGGLSDWGQAATAHFHGTGSPVGVVTPGGVGDLYVDDTTPALWQATGLTSADWTQVGGGGSQPGALASQDVLFTETAGAGTYTATVPVTAGTVVNEIRLYNLASWDADTALLGIGDTENPAGYLDGSSADIKAAFSEVYNPVGAGFADIPASAMSTWTSQADPLFGSGYAGGAGGALGGANLGTTTGTAAEAGLGVRYASDDTITLTLTTTGAGGASGRLLVKVIYFAPVTAQNAVKS